MIFIGIDPAFRKNGFSVAIIDKEDKTVWFPQVRSFFDFVMWAMDPQTHRAKAWICIENSNLQDVTFRRGGKISHKQSRDAGKNQAISQCVVDFCRWAFDETRVVEISPRQKGGKWDDKYTASVARSEGHTFLKKRLSQDDRDAYQLATRAEGFARAPWKIKTA